MTRLIAFSLTIPALPTEVGQFVARNHASLRLGERDQHLHDARLQRLATATADELTGRRTDVDHAEPEWRSMRQADRLDDIAGACQQRLALPRESLSPLHSK
jgi:hypothetical protein